MMDARATIYELSRSLARLDALIAEAQRHAEDLGRKLEPEPEK